MAGEPEPIQTGIAGEDMSSPSSYTEEISEKVKQNYAASIANWDLGRRVDNAASRDNRLNSGFDNIALQAGQAFSKLLLETDYEQANAQARGDVQHRAGDANVILEQMKNFSERMGQIEALFQSILRDRPGGVAKPV